MEAEFLGNFFDSQCHTVVTDREEILPNGPATAIFQLVGRIVSVAKKR